MREVARPVGNPPGDDLTAGALRPVLTRFPGAGAEAVIGGHSRLPADLDRVLGAVGGGQPRLVFRAGRHHAVAEHLPLARVAITEQARGKVVAAAVPLAA